MRKLGAAVALALLAGVSFGAKCTYNGAWDTAPTGETDEIVIQSGELTWGTSLPAKVASWTQTGGTVTFALGASTFFEVAGDVSLTGGTWTHSANVNAAPQDGAGNYRLWVKSGGAFTVGADATISAVGKGYRPEKGPGRHTNQGGGSYGGRGGSTGAESAKCNGSFRCPEFLGSGGSSASYGSVAGGAIKIIAGGALTVNGRIDADASPYKVDSTGTCQYYAGSGGSIWLTGATVMGSGTLTARGGAVTTAGAGGGGRIAVHVTDSDDVSSFNPIVLLCGRTGGSRAAAGGTYYLQTKSDDGAGKLTVYGISSSSSAPRTNVSEIDVSVDATTHVKQLVLSDNAQFAVPSGAVFEVDDVVATESGTANKLCLSGGTLKIPGEYKWTSAQLNVRTDGSAIEFTGVGTRLCASGAGGKLIIDAPITINGDVILENGAKLTHSENGSTPSYSLSLDITGDLTVDAASSIDVTGMGYPDKQGPGKSNSGSIHGGSHGGFSINPGSAKCYGSLRHPTQCGSGGNWSGAENGDWAFGGGTVYLSVKGDTTLNGKIASDGRRCKYYTGAGGSIWLVTKTLTGEGTIHANGGEVWSSVKASGGGGRVSVQLTGEDATFAGFVDAFDGAIMARAGTVGTTVYGAAGTVYLETGAQQDGEGTLIIDNGGYNYATTTTFIGPDVTDTEVGDVIVRNKGYLELADGAMLTVSGDIRNEDGTVKFNDGSIVQFANADRVSTLAGNFTFSKLVCEAPGKTIKFTAGETTTIAAGGALTLTGTEESPITLQSTEEGTAWTLALGAGVSQSMDRLQVSDSIATGGTATALNSSGTNVSGWNFINVIIGELLTWTGAAGDNWNDVGNWDKGRAPIPTDKVLVPSGLPNMPKLYSVAEVMELEVAAGAELKLNGYDLTVDGPVTAGGPITASDTETLTVRGDVDFSANGLTRARATLALAGDDAQSVKLGGRSYWAVDCSQAAAPTFVDSFTTRYLVCTAAEPKTLVFTVGLTATVDELQLSGVVEGAAALQLVSSAPGSAWNLKLRGLATVAGVTIEDCNAADGETLYAAMPSSGARCANIEFGIVPRVWTGAKNADFADAGNWEGGNVPGADDLAVIEKGGSVTISAATTVRELVLGGGDAVTLTVSQPLTVGGSMQIGGGATVSASEKVTVGNSLVMNEGAKLTHPQSGSATATHLFVEVGGDFVLDRGATVDVTGKGYTYLKGPGAPTVNVNVRSATHGGYGVAAGVATCYGSVRHPVTLGSGGGWASDGGSTGGGAVRMAIGGMAEINGEIAADGAYCAYYGGAGGSIWVVAGTIRGIGTLHANGGTRWQAERATGGGGRVSIQLTDGDATFENFVNAFDGAVTAYGGKQGLSAASPSCAAGTVYLQQGDEQDGEGTLIVDNGGCTYTDLATTIEPNVTETDVGSVIIKNGGVLEVKGAATLTVRGDWNNTGTFRVVDGGTLRFADAGIVSHVLTPLVTASFVCEEPYKVIRFATNDVAALQIVDGGLMRVMGSEEDEDGVVSLLSETDGTPWKLKVGADVTQEMQYIKVADSDATVGAMASAMDSVGDDFSKDHNWSIVTVVKGELITWTGAAGSAFGDVGNWDLGRAPLKSDKVKIPAGCANYPTLGAAVEALELEVEAGASLSLGGFDLTVKDNLKVAGALVCSGFETMTVKGLSDFTGSQVTPAHSTLLITGSDNARFMPTGATFNDVRIVRGGNDISVFGGFTANRFEVKATAAAGVAFEDGMTVRAKEVSFDGLVDGVAALELMSVEPGSKWKVVASDATSVRGVRASDCDARGGVAFRAGAPSTVTGCENWVVVTESFAWTGEEDTEFTNANNWAGGVAPGANDFVEIASAATITLSEPWTIGGLKLGGGEEAVKFTATAALTVADTVEIGTNATVALNKPSEIGNALIVHAGGVLTHDKNGATEVNKLNLTVGGNVTIDHGGKIDLKGKGYAKGKGPGAQGVSGAGPSHGGVGCGSNCTFGPTYGSVFHPTTLGSGGTENRDFGTPGGGAIKLVANGTVTVNGELVAEGGDDIVPQYPGAVYSCYYSGAGGSIWIVAGRLEGYGRISVEGGIECHNTAGGGGHMALYLTAADAPSDELEISACGGRTKETGSCLPRAGAGTIYLQGMHDADGQGHVIVRNTGSWVYDFAISNTRLPAQIDGDTAKSFAYATLDVVDGASLRLTSDLTVDELELSSNSKLYLDGHTLTIRSLKHRKRSSAKGYDYTGTVSTGAGGAIRFLPRGLMLFVR